MTPVLPPLSMDVLRVRRNVSWLALAQAANYVLSLVVLPYLFRTLGPAGFGWVALSQATAQYFCIPVDYGFEITGTRKVASTSDPRELGRVASGIMLARIVLLVWATAIYAVLIVSVPVFRREALTFMGSWFLVLGVGLKPFWLLQGRQWMASVAMSHFIGKIVLVFSLFFLVSEPNHYARTAWVYGLSITLTSLVGWLRILPSREVAWEKPTWRRAKAELVDGASAFLTVASSGFYTATPVLVAGLIGGEAASGLLGAVDRVIKALKGLLVPIIQGGFPVIAGAYREGPQVALRLVRKVGSIIVLGSGTASIGLFLFSGAIVSVLMGSGFEDAVPVLRIMAPIPVLVGISMVVVHYVLYAQGEDSKVLSVVLPSGVLGLAGMLALGLYLGVAGIAFALTATEAGVTLAVTSVAFAATSGPGPLRT